MAHHKITYRPSQGGWVVFDADKTDLRTRMNGGELPVVYAGGPEDDPDAVERCHAWIAFQRRRPEGKLLVESAGACGWRVRDADDRCMAMVKTKAQGGRIIKFVGALAAAGA